MAREGKSGATRTLERPGQPAALLLRKCQLTITRGPDRKKHLEIDKRTTCVGSALDNDLVLSDPAVSARHCELSLDDQGFLLRDSGSSNGTWVAGHRVGSVYLHDGTDIEVGSSRIRFSVEREEAELPLAAELAFGPLVGSSPSMRAVFAVLERVGAASSTVLLLGESGTGKSVAARALHQRSPRRDGPFVILDCGAVAPTLFESHLFGHARGAFTGADQERAGAFEQADGGTLVLEEVAELPLELQPKLLRVVESKVVQRVGDSRPRPADVRLIACTHRNLGEMVARGGFRQDLLYRLAVISVSLPPLRERPEDIPHLVQLFMAEHGKDARVDLDTGVVELLMQHPWPGNVRELRNVVERMAVLPEIGLSPGGASPGLDAAAPRPFADVKREFVERFERDYLERLLRSCDGNVSEVARISGLARQSCYRLMHKHGLKGE